MQNLLSDLRFGFRMMARNPGFTVVAILTLALGIGANTAIFSVVNAVLLEPLPYGEPERIVGVWTTGQSVEIDKDIFSPANFLDLAEQNQVFEAVAAYSYFGFDVSDRGGEPTSLTVGLVSPAIFRVLRTEPVLGRTFTAEEGEDGNDAVVVLGHALWAERYGSDPEILGRTLILDGA
ncbi:MAG: ABC transporter permease, partial [Acidobacteriota bacterium]